MDALLATLKFVEIIRPLADELKSSSRRKLADLLIADLIQINVECGYAESKISDEKSLISMLFFAAVKTVIVKEAFGPFISFLEMENYLKHWHDLNQKSRQHVLNISKEISKDLFKRDIKKNKFGILRTPNVVKN